MKYQEHKKTKYPILDWALLRGKDYSLKLRSVKGIKKSHEFLNQYHASITIKGRTFEGCSVDWNEELAATKAIAEAVERSYIIDLGLKNSNGLALHITKQLAQKNAIDELYERDAILRAFYNNKMTWGEKLKLEFFSKEARKILEQFQSLGVVFETHLYSTLNKKKVIVLFAIGDKCRIRPFGVMSGFSMIDQASSSSLFFGDKALFEFLPNLNNILTEPKVRSLKDNLFQDLTLLEFIQIHAQGPKQIGPNEHLRLALNLDYFQLIKSKTGHTNEFHSKKDNSENFSSFNSILNLLKIKKEELYKINLKSTQTHKIDAPFFVAHAEVRSNHLDQKEFYNLEFGIPNPNSNCKFSHFLPHLIA